MITLLQGERPLQILFLQEEINMIPGSIRTVVIVIALLLTSGSVWSPMAIAAPQVTELKDVGYNVQSTLEDNLKALVGKNVYVVVATGKEYSGTVKAVGTHLLHLEKLSGKEYFDALIRLNSIEAIDTRFREPQR